MDNPIWRGSNACKEERSFGCGISHRAEAEGFCRLVLMDAAASPSLIEAPDDHERRNRDDPPLAEVASAVEAVCARR
jgi:hypothetical protein